MEALAPLVLVGWIVAFGVPLSLVVLAFSAYNRLKGMERAIWAVVSQLRAMRAEKTADIDPAATRRALEVADGTDHVKFSMFGR